MTDEELHRFWRERIEGLRRIREHIGDYKECDQCRAVLRKSVGICPTCQCYRFKESEQDLESTCFEMSCHALPVSLPVVQRTTEPLQLTNQLAWGGTRFGEEQNFGHNHE